MYTASAVAYRTASRVSAQHMAEENPRVRTYAPPIEHEVISLAFPETQKYRQAATDGHEGEKVEESDRRFGDRSVVCRGHQQPFFCGRWFPQS